MSRFFQAQRRIRRIRRRSSSSNNSCLPPGISAILLSCCWARYILGAENVVIAAAGYCEEDVGGAGQELSFGPV